MLCYRRGCEIVEGEGSQYCPVPHVCIRLQDCNLDDMGACDASNRCCAAIVAANLLIGDGSNTPQYRTNTYRGLPYYNFNDICACDVSDLHCATGAAAKLLKARDATLPGTVRLLFQPAEEGPGGAFDMVAAGALQGVSAVAGLHVFPSVPSGIITTKVFSQT